MKFIVGRIGRISEDRDILHNKIRTNKYMKYGRYKDKKRIER